MNKLIQIPVILGLNLAFVVGESSALAFDTSWGILQRGKLEQIIKKSKISESQMGIFVAAGEGEGLIVKAHQADKKLIPASISKLAIAATTLSEFPPGTKFKTTIWGSGSIDRGVLKGNLILKGGGDPSFVSENLWYLVNVFTRRQIKTIEGDLIVDDSYFDRIRLDSSRQKERVDRAYDAPAGAMSFNWNSVNIFIRPGKNPGDPAQVFADPENDYIRLKAKVETTKSGGKTAVTAERDEDTKGVGDVLIVNGKIAADSKELVIYKNVTQPDLWSGYNLKSFLKQRGIEITGSVKTGGLPSSAQILAESESKPVEDVLADMNKFSNNYIAEMLTKNVAANEKPPGTIDGGVQVIRKFLAQIGLSPEQFEIYSPSGLTRENKMSAKSLWKVLSYMKDQYRYAPEFMKSLPIAGIDGTLKHRMKDSPAERWVRAKTGYLTGVVSLAGYAGRKDGTVIPFVFIYNGSADESQVRGLFDQLAISLTE